MIKFKNIKTVFSKNKKLSYVLGVFFLLLSIIGLNASLNNYPSYVLKKVALKKWIISKREALEIYLERNKVLSLLDIENYEDLSDMEKVVAIRNWVAVHIDMGENAPFDHHNKEYISLSVHEKMNLFLDNKAKGGFYCAGRARLLSDIYNIMGFPTIDIN